MHENKQEGHIPTVCGVPREADAWEKRPWRMWIFRTGQRKEWVSSGKNFIFRRSCPFSGLPCRKGVEELALFVRCGSGAAAVIKKQNNEGSYLLWMKKHCFRKSKHWRKR